ncbi:acyltransferase family protein [Rugamonas sp. DEMB1]|uniref:acyltransferase family protein n=1 Tax=Rugamonas sp. DEMB1 TaxID=3039386 RepID=UPI00244D29C1|nr:acyltransferase family protein [Rugamonas sp. DEMB1]WGG51390.1 acyltransferase family protein [Rugamonas sp. DEMB1]
MVTGAAWCIPLELAFYLLFPFLSRFALQRGAGYLLQLLGLMLFFKLMVYGESAHSTLMFFSTLVGRFDQFLIGMLGAVLYRRHEALLRRLAGWLLPLALLLVVCDSALQAARAPFNATAKSAFWIGWSLLESGGWAVFIVCWVAWQGRLPALLERLLNHGGKISYSFYLLHMGVIHTLAGKVGLVAPTGVVLLDAALMLAVVYAATWGLATLSYRAIEEPFLRLRGSYGAVPLGPAPAAEPAPAQRRPGA